MAAVFTSENFETEVLKSETPVLVDFYADWCGPCKMMGPVVDQLAGEYEGRFKVGKLNVDNSQDIAAKYGVMTIPTLALFKDGQLKDKVIGVQSKKTLTDMMEKLL